MLKAACSVLFLFVLSRFLRYEDLAGMLRGLSWWPLAASVAVHFLIIGCNALKMALLAESPRAGFKDMFRWNLIKLFVNNLLPSGLGGELARAWYLGKAVGSMGAASAVVICDRLTAQAALTAFSACSLVVLAWGPFPVAADAGLFVLFVAGAAAFCLALFRLIGALNLKRLRMTLGGGPKTAWVEAPGFREFFQALPGRRPMLRRLLGLALLGQALLILRAWFIVMAVAPGQSWLVLPIALTLASFLSSLPVTLGGIGLAEGGFALAFGLGAEAGAIGVTVALLMRLTSLVPAIPGWLLFLARRKAPRVRVETAAEPSRRPVLPGVRERARESALVLREKAISA